MKRILVAGGTGHLGVEVVAELKRRGWWIRLLTRRPEQVRLAVDEVVGADLMDADSLHGVCDGMEAVFSAAGASVDLALRRGSPDFRVDNVGNANLIVAAHAAKVRKFVYVSVFATPVYEHLSYVRAHTSVADLLRQTDFASAIIQPTGFFSAFAVLPRMVRFGVAPLIGDGEALTNPIHEQDLALVCADTVENGEGEIPVGGPEVLSRRAIFERAFEAVGKKPRFVRVPNGLVRFNQGLVARLDPRLGALIAFFQAVSQTAVVAPAHGNLRLGDYFRDLVARPR